MPDTTALFLDFAGTLVEIAPRPDAVRVDPDLVPTLERLRERLGGALAIVTGRPVSVIDGFLAGLPYERLVPAIQRTNTTIDVPVAALGMTDSVSV